MAKAVNMHPLLTMASILVFGQIGGFWGALFGIPIASTIGMLAPPTAQLVHNYLNPEVDSQPQAQPQQAALLLPYDKAANGEGEGEGETLSTSLSTPEGTN
jgi:hypothetical protein